MIFFLSIWFALGTITALIWLGRNIFLTRTLQAREHLGSNIELRTLNFEPPNPRVSVIVAAKDEEANIELSIRGLLNQDYVNFEVIVINDRSADGTAAILARLQQEFGDRLNVLTVCDLPEGWFGKNNAMRKGVEASTGDWLFFTDADCRYNTRSMISAAMDDVLARKVDFLTVIPGLEFREVWERILQPVCSLVLMYWFQPEKVNDSRSGVAYANGTFMLMSRQCYDAIGGHGAVRAQLNEDIHMAVAAKKCGQRLRVVENGGHYTTRMYSSLTGAVRGWTRIFAGSFSTVRRVLKAATLILITSVIPWLGLMMGIIAGALTSNTAQRSWWAASGMAWGLAALLMQACFWRLYGAIGFGRRWSLLYAAGALGVFGILINALSKVSGLRSVTWRGTKYRAGIQAAK